MTNVLTYAQEMQIINGHGLTGGQFYALPESAKAALHSSLGVNDSAVAAASEMYDVLKFIDNINGSTGGHKSMVDEFKFRAREVLAKVDGKQTTQAA